MSLTNQQLIAQAFQKADIVDEAEQPTAIQGTNGLNIANGYFATRAADGMRIGWWPQTNPAANAPVRAEDVHDVIMLLAIQIGLSYDSPITDASFLAEVEAADKRLAKRSLLYMESDLSELSRAQGAPWGGGAWL